MVVCVGFAQVQSNKSLAAQSKTKHNNKNLTPNQMLFDIDISQKTKEQFSAVACHWAYQTP